MECEGDKVFLGYDPGGDGRNAVAILKVTRNQFRYDLEIVESVDHALKWFQEKAQSSSPVGIGIDTLLSWETGPHGRRGPDEWLSEQKKIIRNAGTDAPSIQSCNSLRGSMLVQGIALAMRIKEKFNNISLNETHPKMLHFVYNKTIYPESWTNGGQDDHVKWLIGEITGTFGPAIDSSDKIDSSEPGRKRVE